MRTRRPAIQMFACAVALSAAMLLPAQSADFGLPLNGMAMYPNYFDHKTDVPDTAALQYQANSQRITHSAQPDCRDPLDCLTKDAPAR